LFPPTLGDFSDAAIKSRVRSAINDSNADSDDELDFVGLLWLLPLPDCMSDTGNDDTASADGSTDGRRRLICGIAVATDPMLSVFRTGSAVARVERRLAKRMLFLDALPLEFLRPPPPPPPALLTDELATASSVLSAGVSTADALRLTPAVVVVVVAASIEAITLLSSLSHSFASCSFS
jgi:hypothetical protein